MIKEMTIQQYTEWLASDEPTIGGGTASALSSAMGAGLVMMVANLSIGRKKYAQFEQVFVEALEKMREVKALLLDKADEDKAAFEAVMQAFKLPKSNEEEIALRNKAIEDATIQAALVPLSVALWAIEVTKSAIPLIEHGNVNARSDGLVGAQLASAGFNGAIYNVRINLASIEDKGFVSEIEEKIQAAISQMNVFESMWKRLAG